MTNVTPSRYVGTAEEGWCDNDDHLIRGDHMELNTCINFVPDSVFTARLMDEAKKRDLVANLDGEVEARFVSTYRPY